MSTPAPTRSARPAWRKRLIRALEPIPGAVAFARLFRETVRITMRYRVTGLASEVAFYALMSLPPLVLGLFGGIGYVGNWLGEDTVRNVTETVAGWAGKFLTNESVSSVIIPTVDEVLRNGRADLISVGAILSIWSGSRALNVILDTVSIMYGQGGERGIVRTRVMSLSLYAGSVLAGAVILPLVVIGPTWLGEWLPDRLNWLLALYWPVVTLATVGLLTTLYHIATPRRAPWRRDVPGALLTLAMWLLIAYLTRVWIGGSIGGPSIYGPLAAPIIVMIWLYFMAFSLLVGAALNGAVRRLWPTDEVPGVGSRALDWLSSEMEERRRRRRHQVLAPLSPEVQEELDAQDDWDEAHDRPPDGIKHRGYPIG